MAAETRTVHRRGRRCRRHHLVRLCQSWILHGRGRQFHRQEEGRGPSDSELCDDTVEEQLVVLKGSEELPVSWLLSGEEELS